MNKNKLRRIVITYYQYAEKELKTQDNITDDDYYYTGIMDVCDGILKDLENEK